MPKINLLEFKIKDNLFGIRTEYIKTIFDIEKIKPLVLMPDYVAGITSVGKQAYLLICLENLLGLSEGKCEDPVGKTAIVVNVYGKLYALIVDEILKIEEIEKKGADDIVNFYNKQGVVLEEITPEFLKLKIKVPALKYEKIKTEEKTKTSKDTSYKTFLIFELDDNYFALNTDYIRKVEYLENLKKSITAEDELVEGVFLVKNSPVKALNFKKLFKLDTDEKEESLIILEKDKKDFGIKADSVLDILSVAETELNKSENPKAILKDFFVYKDTIIPVFSDKYLEELLEKYALTREKTEEEKKIKIDEKDFLIVDILGETFAIPMEKIAEVLEYEDIHITTYPSESEYIKGLGAFRDKSFFVFTLENILNKEIDTSNEDTKVIVLEENGVYTSILISEIKDIISIPLDRISQLETEESIIGGIVIDKNGEIINIINLRWMLGHKENKND